MEDDTKDIKDTERWHRPKWSGLVEHVDNITGKIQELMRLEAEQSLKKITRLKDALERHGNRKADS